MIGEDLDTGAGGFNPVNWKRLLVISAVILLLTSCLGALAGAAYLWADQAGYFPGWQNLESPPADPVEFVTGDLEQVFVRTADGNIYRCSHEGLSSEQDCWVITREPPNVDPEVEFNNPVMKSEINPPAGEILDELVATIWYADAAFETRYTLLADGTVWKKESTRTAYLTFAVCVLAPFAGAAIGFIIILAIWGIAAIRRMSYRTN